MLEKTKTLLSKIKKFEDIPDRVECLKDYYDNEDCFILAAGPSLNSYDVNYVKEKLEGKLVISLKQSIKNFIDVTDFHILNFANYEPYKKYTPNTIVVWEVYEHFHPKMILDNNIRCDVMLPIDGNRIQDTIEKNLKSQCGEHSWDKYTLDKTLTRWYGPGIMFQTAIHLAEHLGVKSITTLGWDIADMNSFKDDPYDESFQKHSYEGKSNIVYAPTPTNKHEAETVIKSTKFLNEWLMSKNIDFKIISETNPAHESIERITL